MCDHTNQKATVRVINLEDTGKTMAEIEISCSDCGTPYRFIGLPMGMSLRQPSTDVDGTELRIPIELATGRNHPLSIVRPDAERSMGN